jgi:hypothetical protein
VFGTSHVVGLLGISATSLVDAFLKAITNWIDNGSAAIVEAVGTALDETTSVAFGASFSSLFRSMRAIGASCSLIFLVAATVQAIVKGDLGSLVRTVVVRLPIALVGSAGAIWLVEEGLALTDAFSSSLLAQEGGTGARFSNTLAGLLVGSRSVLSGFEGVVLALVTAAGAFLVWIELIVRSSAVLCASLFLPLALAGVIWPATEHWIRRLAETLCALILAKLAMVAVLVLGVTSIGDADGVSGVIEGVAILVLSAVSPFVMLRMLPFIEHGAVAHFDGAGRGAARAVAGLDFRRVIHPFGGGPGQGSGDVTPQRDPVPKMTGPSINPQVFARHYADVLGELQARARGGDAPGGQHQ